MSDGELEYLAAHTPTDRDEGLVALLKRVRDAERGRCLAAFQAALRQAVARGDAYAESLLLRYKETAEAVAAERERCLMACEAARPVHHRGKHCDCGECAGALSAADLIREGAYE